MTRQREMLRVPLAGLVAAEEREDIACPRCGSRGFNVHQRTIKRVKDPFVDRVAVTRYLCKNCRSVWRHYPAGLAAGRQTESLRQLIRLLACLGLTFNDIRVVLENLGCPLSVASIRQTVRAIRIVSEQQRTPGLYRFRVDEAGQIHGPGGAVALRLVATSDAERWLEIECPAVAAEEIRWRIDVCIN